MGAWEDQMKFLGQSEIAAYVHDHPGEAEMLRAWVGEIKHGTWETAEGLRADFLEVDVSTPPLAIFRLGRRPVRVETIFDFRNRIVLLTALRLPAGLWSLHLQHGNA